MSDNYDNKGRLFYDGHCLLCCRLALRFQSLLQRNGFQLSPLPASNQGPSEASFREIRVVLSDGRRFGGADAIAEVCRNIWWAWPFWVLSQVPGTKAFWHGLYRIIAANRHCLGGRCRVADRDAWSDWLPLMLLPLATITLRQKVPAWAFMWLLALALFFGCKYLTWRRATTRHPHRYALAYLLAWPGMDADAFLGRTAEERPARSERLLPIGQIVAGALLTWLATKELGGAHPLVVGWIGMVGIVLMLHFGFFRLLSLSWRMAGRNAKPLMQQPLAATCLADFWGNRWNTAFSKLVHRFVFRKLVRPLGVAWATFVVFLVSGLVHDLVISLPARGGYGWPTMYFLLQAAGVLFERSPAGRHLGLGCGSRGWIYVLVVTAGPAFWLFHPPFIHNVILPLLRGLGSTTHDL